MKDRFFTKKRCDRCGKLLTGGRIMSRFNEECICMECSETEEKHPDYKKVCDAELAQIKKGKL